MKLTANFSKSEFECRCGCEMPKGVFNNIVKLANQLQILRNKVNAPIKINSAYRCPKHNAKQPGSSVKSQHLFGRAADIVVKDYKPNETADIIEELIKNGEYLQGGLGRYNSFTHTDIRKTAARWNYSDE
jgi:uncharacterized protein YcbK (DUF882 family)